MKHIDNFLSLRNKAESGLGLDLEVYWSQKLGMVAYTFNPSIGKAETGGSQ